MRTRLLALALALSPAFAGAQLVTSTAAFLNPQVVDISGRAGAGYNYTNGPVALPGGVTFTAAGSISAGAVFGQGAYIFGTNGSWGGSLVYAGSDGPFASFRFTFDDALRAVGAFVNYDATAGGTTPRLRLLGQGGNLLEEFDLAASAPISTPGGFNAGAFRGAVRAGGDIHAIEFANVFIAATDITFDVATTVPEPATLALVAGGLAVLGAAARRRRSA